MWGEKRNLVVKMMCECELVFFAESLCLLFGFISLSDRLSSVLLRLTRLPFFLFIAVFSAHWLALDVQYFDLGKRLRVQIPSKELFS